MANANDKKPTIGIYIVFVILILSIFIDGSSVINEFNRFAVIHTNFRIADMVLRSIGVVGSLVAVMGLWKMKKYGYNATIITACAFILTSLLIYLPGATYADASLYPTFTKIRNIIVIVTWLSILGYIYSRHKDFKA